MKRYLRLSILLLAILVAAATFGTGISAWVSPPAISEGASAYLVVLDAPDGFVVKARILGFTDIQTMNFSELGTSVHRVAVPNGTQLEAALHKLQETFPDIIIDQSDS